MARLPKLLCPTALVLGLLLPAPGTSAAPPVTQLPGLDGCVSQNGDGICENGRTLNGATAVAVSPDGENVYVSSSAGGTVTDGVAVLARDATSGALDVVPNPNACVAVTNFNDCRVSRGLDGAHSVTVSPDGENVYVVGNENDTVAIFTRNATHGGLTQLSGTAGCISETGQSSPSSSNGDCAIGRVLERPTSVTLSPDGEFAYVLSEDGLAAFDRNTTTGALTQLAGTDGCITNTGSGGECTDGRGLVGRGQVTISPNGASAYVANGSFVVAFSRNTATGVLTPIAGTGGCVTEFGGAADCADGRALGGARAVAVSPDGKGVYVSSNGALAVLARNTSTGALTQVAGSGGCVTDNGTFGFCTTGTGGGSLSIAVSADNTRVYAGLNFFSRNTTTNVLSQLPGTAGCITSDGSAGRCSSGVAVSGLGAVALSPDGENLYGAGGDAVTAFAIAPDGDNDGVTDATDNCSALFNPGQENVDGDASGDACDSNADGDSAPNATDNCPLAPNNNQANADGDAQGDACDPDDDNDGDADAEDNCPLVVNGDQANTDGDAQGNACDGDDDNDGDPDGADNCQFTANADQRNTDLAGDGGDACDGDDDNDGHLDGADNCQLVPNAAQQNNDGDGEGDPCDADDDNDAAEDKTDNCPLDSNADQRNSDGLGDGGDACDAEDDGDGTADAADNCPSEPNPGQEDLDRDGQGDRCDPDDDDDGDPDGADNCPTAFDPDQADADGSDGGDVCDPDDDNDTLSDTDEEARNTSPVDLDSDDDGLADGAETTTNPADSDSDNDKLQDGTELGLTSGIAAQGGVRGTDLDEFEPDADPRSKTRPDSADTDRDRLKDGVEDRNRDGKRQRNRETDPRRRDTDRDGVNDRRDRAPLSGRRR